MTNDSRNIGRHIASIECAHRMIRKAEEHSWAWYLANEDLARAHYLLARDFGILSSWTEEECLETLKYWQEARSACQT